MDPGPWKQGKGSNDNNIFSYTFELIHRCLRIVYMFQNMAGEYSPELLVGEHVQVLDIALHEIRDPARYYIQVDITKNGMDGLAPHIEQGFINQPGSFPGNSKKKPGITYYSYYMGEGVDRVN